jgi:ribonuclease E
MLIQVSKEERGNKGAAVTTYLSMPGRYCVLMPNSPRGGGVSRKIASFTERKRMKEMLDELAVPEGMSVILRTAGVTRTKVEIKRDLDYLTRLWNTIREHTLKSVAPALIYEEGSLIKRAIRDLYARDIDDIHVSGEEGHRAAKDFMRMLMPSHAKKVQEYKNDRVPMFHKFGVESQIADIGEPSVTLKSGGYLVINPTEALVSIDVNSGRATKERHIEETALKTNLEAADEVARQLRLRDLGGLVVIDFIDMEDRRNNRKVEQRLRDALSSDRARIQVGRISSFGLLELSRQRLNPSLAEAQQEICPHCMGTGRVKTLDFAAISIIRALEAEGVKNKGHDIILTLAPDVGLYILNNKRGLLATIEARYGFGVAFKTDASLSNSQYTMEASARALPKITEGGIAMPVMEEGSNDHDESDESFEADETTQAGENDDSRNRGRRGRRGGRGRGRDRQDRDDRGERPERAPRPQRSFEAGTPEGGHAAHDDAAGAEGDDNFGNRAEPSGEESVDSAGKRLEDGPGRRRRGRRGGRGRGRDRDDRPERTGERQEHAPRGSAPSAPQDDVLILREDHAPRTESGVHAAPPIQVAPRPSNDAPPAPKEYEVVNQPPSSKKKGWWNKLVE